MKGELNMFIDYGNMVLNLNKEELWIIINKFSGSFEAKMQSKNWDGDIDLKEETMFKYLCGSINRIDVYESYIERKQRYMKLKYNE
jgi:hypothetical protein